VAFALSAGAGVEVEEAGPLQPLPTNAPNRPTKIVAKPLFMVFLLVTKFSRASDVFCARELRAALQSLGHRFPNVSGRRHYYFVGN
jgi:hypothetical protein